MPLFFGYHLWICCPGIGFYRIFSYFYQLRNLSHSAMYYKSALLVIFFFLSHSSFAQSRITSKHIKVLMAAEAKWSPGMVQQNNVPGGGKVYRVQIKIRKKGNYEFEKLIVANESLDMEMVSEEIAEKKTVLKKCSEWEVVARSSKKEVMHISDPTIAQLIKENQLVAGWIQYKFEDQVFVRPIKLFQQSSTVPNQ